MERTIFPFSSTKCGRIQGRSSSSSGVTSGSSAENGQCSSTSSTLVIVASPTCQRIGAHPIRSTPGRAAGP